MTSAVTCGSFIVARTGASVLNSQMVQPNLASSATADLPPRNTRPPTTTGCVLIDTAPGSA